MLNLVPSLTQYWFSISFCPRGEILKRLQDDGPRNFKYCCLRSFYGNEKSRLSKESSGLTFFFLLVLLFLKKGLKIDDLILFRPVLLFLPGRHLP